MAQKTPAKPALVRAAKDHVPAKGSLIGSQTLLRGLDIMEAVASGVTNLAALIEAINVNRSTTHRLATTLVERRYLSFRSHAGYALGPKLLEMGYQARNQMTLPGIAREHLDTLAHDTGDTVHLAILDGTRVLYLDKIAGSRRVDVSSRIGDRQPVRSTGLGKALVLDANEAQLQMYYELENRKGGGRYGVSLNTWLRRMRDYVKLGYALDLEESEDHIRCIGAPIRDATGEIVASISLSSASQYIDDKRIKDVAEDVRVTAQSISRALGWNEAKSRAGKPALRTRNA